MKRNETLGPTVVWTTVNTDLLMALAARRLRPTHFPAVFSGTQTAKSSCSRKQCQAGDTIRLECWSSLSAGHDG